MHYNGGYISVLFLSIVYLHPSLKDNILQLLFMNPISSIATLVSLTIIEKIRVT